MSTAAGPPESDIRKVSNIGEDNNFLQGHQQQQQRQYEHHRRQQQKGDPQ